MQILSAFLISYVRYGEQDSILRCYTEENGFEDFFIKGLYSKKFRKKPYLSPLNELLLTVSDHHLKSKINSIRKLELKTHNDLAVNHKARSILFFTADFLNQYLSKENPSSDFYNEITEFLDKLKNEKYSSHVIFLLRCLYLSGLAPLISDNPFLNPETGTFVLNQHNKYFTKEISAIWKDVFENEKFYHSDVHSADRNKLLDSILIYYQYHFPDFHIPKSLNVLQQIFR